MVDVPLWLTFATTLLSGLAGALISTVIFIHRETYRIKVDTLKKFAANRYDLKGDEFSRALNEIFVVFNDTPEVMKSLGEFHRLITSTTGGSSAKDDALIHLYKTMCRDTKIRFEHFNDSFFLKPFNTRDSSKVQAPFPDVSQLLPPPSGGGGR